MATLGGVSAPPLSLTTGVTEQPLVPYVEITGSGDAAGAWSSPDRAAPRLSPVAAARQQWDAARRREDTLAEEQSTYAYWEEESVEGGDSVRGDSSAPPPPSPPGRGGREGTVPGGSGGGGSALIRERTVSCTRGLITIEGVSVAVALASAQIPSAQSLAQARSWRSVERRRQGWAATGQQQGVNGAPSRGTSARRPRAVESPLPTRSASLGYAAGSGCTPPPPADIHHSACMAYLTGRGWCVASRSSRWSRSSSVGLAHDDVALCVGMMHLRRSQSCQVDPSGRSAWNGLRSQSYLGSPMPPQSSKRLSLLSRSRVERMASMLSPMPNQHDPAVLSAPKTIVRLRPFSATPATTSSRARRPARLATSVRV